MIVEGAAIACLQRIGVGIAAASGINRHKLGVWSIDRHAVAVVEGHAAVFDYHYLVLVVVLRYLLRVVVLLNWQGCGRRVGGRHQQLHLADFTLGGRGLLQRLEHG